VIVDYANVFASLEKALAIYGKGGGSANPVRDKAELAQALARAVDDASSYCANKGVDLAGIEALPQGDFQRLKKIDDGVNELISPDALRRDFFGHERLVDTLYRAVKPDLAALAHTGRVACLATLADAIRAKLNPNPPDIGGVMAGINALLDASITGHEIREGTVPALDLSKINFEALIESYNAGSRSIEELFQELVKLSGNLDEEEQRHVRENLSEEALVIFDILTRPSPELSTEERTEVKKVARDLLARLKELLVLSWRQKSAARSQIKLAIEDTLDSGLPRVARRVHRR
jgi:type I restriction enzyme R subunit